MNSKISRLTALFVIAAMIFSLSACGSSGSEDESSGSKSGNTQASENGYAIDRNESSNSDIFENDGSNPDEYPENSDYTDFSEDNSVIRNELDFEVYKTGSDKVHFVVKGEKCGDLANESAEIRIHFSDPAGTQVTVSHNYASLGTMDTNGEWISFYADSYTGFFSIYEDYTGVTLEGPGIANLIPEGAEYIIYVHNGNYELSNKTAYGHGNLTAIYTLSESEFNAFADAEAVNFKPAKRASDFWAGNYLFSTGHSEGDMYIYENGYATIELTANGAVLISVHSKNTDKTFVLEESSFDKADYDYGTVIEAKADLPSDNGNQRATLFYSGNERGTDSFSFSYYDNTDYDKSMSLSLTKYQPSMGSAPADYDDTDRYGYISNELGKSGGFLSPATDNYVVVYNGNQTQYYDGEALNCATIELYEYDINDQCIGYRESIFADSSEDLNKIFSQFTQWNSKDYVMAGDRINYTTDYMPSTTKDGLISYCDAAYNGAHYVYYDTVKYPDYAEYEVYKYFSQPVRRTGFLDFETVRKLIGIEIGDHRSIDSENAEMYTNFDTYSGNFTYSVYANDMSYTFYKDATYILEDTTFKSITYSNGYSYEEDKVLIYTAEIGEEIATVTRYTYIVDGFSNIQITLNNYESFTPDEVVSHKFDMTRVKH